MLIQGPYKICRILCNRKLTVAIAIQQQNPIIIGFPPFFINLIISVFNPMALIAITIKNLLSCFKVAKLLSAAVKDAPEQKLVIMVVIIEARIK